MTMEQRHQRSGTRSLKLPVDWRFGARAFLWLLILTLITLFLTNARFY
ncbi:MAG: hypothetical protein H6851_16365 [Geminicoccaceae bacterium]|nr:hypothetical protein [Geminicoccaceae bacterium]MCB9945181.1 hypothetical protein [Geminicoccaceae bacterium]